MSAVEAAHSLLNVPGKPDALHRVKNEPGYHTPTFAAKDEQRAKVQALIASKVFLIVLYLVQATDNVVCRASSRRNSSATK